MWWGPTARLLSEGLRGGGATLRAGEAEAQTVERFHQRGGRTSAWSRLFDGGLWGGGGGDCGRRLIVGVPLARRDAAAAGGFVAFRIGQRGTEVAEGRERRRGVEGSGPPDRHGAGLATCQR
jgi:hypothetical protein